MGNNIEWGHRNNSEFSWIMIGIVAVCGIGFLSSIFPIFEAVITAILIGLAGCLAFGVGCYVLYQRHLDWEAFHGPLPIEEKDKENP